jgi:hypothetical protein
MEPVLRGDRDEIVDSLGMGLPKALNEWTNLSFDQRPLRDVVAEIQQSHAVKIVIDARALAKENRFDTQQITWKPKAVRLSSMLTLLLSQHGLDWTVDRSGITVTTPGAIQRQMFTASYPAKELFKFQTGNVSKAVNLTAISNLFSTSVSPGTWQEVGGPGAIRQGTKDTLEIRQNFWAHQEIARLLEDLRIAIQSMKF